MKNYANLSLHTDSSYHAQPHPIICEYIHLFQHFKVTQHYEYKALAINREQGLPRAHLQTLDPNIHARVIRFNFQAYVRSSCVPLVDIYGCESGKQC